MATSPGWTKDGNLDNAQFGFAVATAGDINGDGYSDLLVGAPQYANGQTGEGAAFLYHGTAAGPANTPAWTYEGNQTGMVFGSAVSTAGDVNNDGYSDVIIGAAKATNGQTQEGRVYVYHGSATGLGTTQAWYKEANLANAHFGAWVGCAGDVDGDGYGDVVIGAPDLTNGLANEGKTFVYYGTTTGLGSAPWTVEGEQLSANYGFCAAIAGDVNGDGYSDVVVGAPNFDNGELNEGRAFVYFGGSATANTDYFTYTESNQASALFGDSVNATGDMNADGYGDVIIGCPNIDNGQTNEGRAYTYGGNLSSRAIRSIIPQQRRYDNSAIVSLLGQTGNSSGVRLAALGRTPFGRSKIKMECEVKPLGVPFNGAGTTITTLWRDTAIAGFNLNEQISGLAGNMQHWRARFWYDLVSVPYQSRSRWFSIPINGRKHV